MTPHRDTLSEGTQDAGTSTSDPVRRAGDILAVVVLGMALAIMGGALLALFVAVVVDSVQ